MQITEITVHAGQVFPHPHVSYANLRPALTLKATVAEGESVDEAIAALQAIAHAKLELHKLTILKQLADAYARERAEEEAAWAADRARRQATPAKGSEDEAFPL